MYRSQAYDGRGPELQDCHRRAAQRHDFLGPGAGGGGAAPATESGTLLRVTSCFAVFSATSGAGVFDFLIAEIIGLPTRLPAVIPNKPSSSFPKTMLRGSPSSALSSPASTPFLIRAMAITRN